MNATIGFTLITLLLLAGCNTPRLATRTLQAEDRVVTGVEKTVLGEDGKWRSQRIICPEPSPDALKTIAASGTASKEEIATIAAAYQESAANIGLRTQSIQLLRDQLFSICQAYANGAISDAAYRMYLTRNQRNTVAIMAIEQLTGVARGPNVTLTSSSAASQANDLLEQGKVLAAAQEQYKGLDANSDKAKELKKSIDKIQARLEQSRADLVNTAGTASSTAGTVGQIDSARVQNVAATVESIVTSVTEVNDLFYLCIDAYSDERSPQPLKDACSTVFAKAAEGGTAVRNTERPSR